MLWELGTFPLSASPMYIQRFAHGTGERRKFGPHERQYLLYFLPPEKVQRQETWIMFFHGGGWRFGQPGMFPQFVNMFLDMGYPIVLPAYRLCPRFSFPHMREDLNLALKTTLTLMEEVVGKPQSIVVGGMSAGANLAAHLLFNTDALAHMGISPAIFKGFLCCGGPLDLHYLPDTFPLRQFTGDTHGSHAFQTANPISLLSKDSPVVDALFIHGTDDMIVPYKSALSFFEEYQHIGRATFLTLKHKKHLDAIRWISDDKKTKKQVKAWVESVTS